MAKTKFEALIEHIINEDNDTARDLLHDIIVEKSREIYNQVVSEDDYEGDESDDFINDVESADDDVDGDEEGMDQSMDDASDDLESDLGVSDEGPSDDDSDPEELEDRIVDLEAALDDLKAEFDEIVGGDDMGGDDLGGDDLGAEFGGDDLGGDEFGSDDFGDEMGGDEEMDSLDSLGGDDFGDDEEEEQFPREGIVREYKEKAPQPKTSEEGANTKSPVIGGKNDMGGSAGNIAKGGSNSAPDGQRPKTADVPKVGSFGQGMDTRRKDTFKKAAPKPTTKEEGGTNDKSVNLK